MNRRKEIREKAAHRVMRELRWQIANNTFDWTKDPN